MMRVTITYNSAGESHKPALPRRVLAKLTPTDGGPAMRARMKMSRYIRTEHDFYATMTRGIADAVGGMYVTHPLHHICERADFSLRVGCRCLSPIDTIIVHYVRCPFLYNFSAHFHPYSYPPLCAPFLCASRCACYFTSYDAPTDRSVLLLEDLKARPGEYECDQIKGCSGTEAEVAVAALAKLHAYFYNRAHSMAPFARSLVGSIPTTDEGLVGFNFSLKQLRDGLPHFRDKAAGLGYGPESKSVRAVERLMSGSNLLNLYIDMTPRDEGGQSDGTLMWGDARADNVIFFRGDHGRLSCVLIDWQLARTGPGECDLAQFLSGSLRREHRREFTVPLLRVYHAELTRALVARGVATPPFESVLCGFQRGLLFLARVLPLMGSDAMHDTSKSERANALIESIFCGVMDALAAWDADDWLAAFEQRNMGGAKPSTLDDDIRLLPSWARTAASAATPSPRKSML